MGYQPDASNIPPGDHMPPLAIISPLQVEHMDRVARERHQMGIEEMYANLAYWSARWRRFKGQRAYRKSTPPAAQADAR